MGITEGLELWDDTVLFTFQKDYLGCYVVRGLWDKVKSMQVMWWLAQKKQCWKTDKKPYCEHILEAESAGFAATYKLEHCFESYRCCFHYSSLLIHLGEQWRWPFWETWMLFLPLTSAWPSLAAVGVWWANQQMEDLSLSALSVTVLIRIMLKNKNNRKEHEMKLYSQRNE